MMMRTAVVVGVVPLLLLAPARAMDYFVTTQSQFADLNNIDFDPGDNIFLQGGSTFSGNLYFDPNDTGTDSSGRLINPITLTSFGTGRATIAAGTGGFGVFAFNNGGITIDSVNFTGAGKDRNIDQNGLNFFNDTTTRFEGLTFRNLDISGFGGFKNGTSNLKRRHRHRHRRQHPRLQQPPHRQRLPPRQPQRRPNHLRPGQHHRQPRRPRQRQRHRPQLHRLQQHRGLGRATQLRLGTRPGQHRRRADGTQHRLQQRQPQHLRRGTRRHLDLRLPQRHHPAQRVLQQPHGRRRRRRVRPRPERHGLRAPVQLLPRQRRRRVLGLQRRRHRGHDGQHRPLQHLRERRPPKLLRLRQRHHHREQGDGAGRVWQHGLHQRSGRCQQRRRHRVHRLRQQAHRCHRRQQHLHVRRRHAAAAQARQQHQ